LGKDRILEFLNLESAQNIDLKTTFLSSHLVKCNKLIFQHILGGYF